MYTINYLVGLVHDLLPLPEELENDLITQLVNYLTQSKSIQNKDTNPSGSYNGTSSLNACHQILLHKILKELAREPIIFSNKTLGKFHFKTQINNYDYQENVDESDSDA